MYMYPNVRHTIFKRRTIIFFAFEFRFSRKIRIFASRNTGTKTLLL